MRAYTKGCEIEEQGLEMLYGFLPRMVRDFWRDSQKGHDLVLATGHSTELLTVELKVEVDNKYGNLFLETWSNKKWNNPGWLYKTTADLLFYLFLHQRILYSVRTRILQDWAKENLGRFKEKPQVKYDQKNDTYGVPVPISVLIKECGMKTFNL